MPFDAMSETPEDIFALERAGRDFTVTIGRRLSFLEVCKATPFGVVFTWADVGAAMVAALLAGPLVCAGEQQAAAVLFAIALVVQRVLLALVSTSRGWTISVTRGVLSMVRDGEREPFWAAPLYDVRVEVDRTRLRVRGKETFVVLSTDHWDSDLVFVAQWVEEARQQHGSPEDVPEPLRQARSSLE